MRTPLQVKLTDEERAELEKISRCYTLPHRQVVRAQTILLLADGLSVSAVGRRAQLERRIVRKWAERFNRTRLAGLDDQPRSGRPARFSPGGGAAPGQARV
jgi:hypothetical protein